MNLQEKRSWKIIIWKLCIQEKSVVMNGYPRNSIFMDHEKADQVTKKLGNEDYTTMAYMPTWRGQNDDVNTSEYSREINQLLHYLDENLKDDQKLYVNFHPIVQK